MRLADDVGAADDDCPLAALHARPGCRFSSRSAAERRAGHQRLARCRSCQAADVDHVKAVDVLVRVDRRPAPPGAVDLPGQGQLNQDAVDRRVGCSAELDQVEKLALAGLHGQAMLEGVHAGFRAVWRRLVAHVDLAGRILADQDGGQAGGSVRALLSVRATASRPTRLAQAGREGLAVDDPGLAHRAFAFARHSSLLVSTTPPAGLCPASDGHVPFEPRRSGPGPRLGVDPLLQNFRVACDEDRSSGGLLADRRRCSRSLLGRRQDLARSLTSGRVGLAALRAARRHGP